MAKLFYLLYTFFDFSFTFFLLLKDLFHFLDYDKYSVGVNLPGPI